MIALSEPQAVKVKISEGIPSLISSSGILGDITFNKMTCIFYGISELRNINNKISPLYRKDVTSTELLNRQVNIFTLVLVQLCHHRRTRVVGGDSHPRRHIDSTHTACCPDDGGLASVPPTLEVSDCTGLAALIQNLDKIDLLLSGSDCVIMSVDSEGVLIGIDLVDSLSPRTIRSLSHYFYTR